MNAGYWASTQGHALYWNSLAQNIARDKKTVGISELYA
jgi:hypothetical protein